MARLPLAVGVGHVTDGQRDAAGPHEAVSPPIPDLLLALQRAAGNAAVSRLVESGTAAVPARPGRAPGSRATPAPPVRRVARNGLVGALPLPLGGGGGSAAAAPGGGSIRAAGSLAAEWLEAISVLPALPAVALAGAVLLYTSNERYDENEMHRRDRAAAEAAAGPASTARAAPTAPPLDPAILEPHLPPALMRLILPRITPMGALADPLGAGLTPDVVAELARRAGIRTYAPTALRRSSRCVIPYDQQRYEAMVASMYSQMMLTNAATYFRGRSWPVGPRVRGRELGVRVSRTTNACALVVVNRAGCVVAESVGTKPLGSRIHAEMSALPTLLLNLNLAPLEERAGPSLRVISTQQPCPEICYPALRAFAAANGVFYRRGAPYEVIVPRPSIERSANVLGRDWPMF